jgi:lipopolysaccharide biosynthesis glycosyltransferase
MTLRVFIGYDPREKAAFEVAENSLRAHRWDAATIPLRLDRLASSGLLRRSMDARGQLYDLPSNAPCSTEFAISRFLVPILCQSGWALCVDCDVVFLGDVAELFALADPTKAVMVVKHQQAGGGMKMDGQVQTHYARKNWSSVVLWNCDHPANRRLSLQDVNERPGRDLHAFYWLADSEIGELPGKWNWLVGVQPMPADAKIAHFTLGGPFTPGWQGAEHDEIWLRASRTPEQIEEAA